MAVPLEEMVEIAQRRGSVRWPDGAVTVLSLEDTHLFGMVLARHYPDGRVEPLTVDSEFDCAPVEG